MWEKENNSSLQISFKYFYINYIFFWFLITFLEIWNAAVNILIHLNFLLHGVLFIGLCEDAKFKNAAVGCQQMVVKNNGRTRELTQ